LSKIDLQVKFRLRTNYFIRLDIYKSRTFKLNLDRPPKPNSQVTPSPSYSSSTRGDESGKEGGDVSFGAHPQTLAGKVSGHLYHRIKIILDSSE
jgi:hypothetical protein